MKSEIRRPKAERRPNSETRSLPIERYCQDADTCLFRNSDFGFLSDFGTRPSGFGTAAPAGLRSALAAAPKLRYCPAHEICFGYPCLPADCGRTGLGHFVGSQRQSLASDRQLPGLRRRIRQGGLPAGKIALATQVGRVVLNVPRTPTAVRFTRVHPLPERRAGTDTPYRNHGFIRRGGAAGASLSSKRPPSSRRETER
jgi:hypothetical protein